MSSDFTGPDGLAGEPAGQPGPDGGLAGAGADDGPGLR